jgi:hypothetical protein
MNAEAPEQIPFVLTGDPVLKLFCKRIVALKGVY